MNFLSIQRLTPLFAILFCFGNSWIASALTINITQAPYNAVPANTGSLDNGVIINNVINALRAQGGGTIYIPAGNWKFTTAISIVGVTGERGSIILRGDGAHPQGWQGGTDLIFENRTGTADAITISGQTGSGIDIPQMLIRDLAIDGGMPNEVTGYKTLNNRNGLVLDSAHFFQISGVTVTGFNGTGIVINNSYYGSVRDANVAYCGIGIDCQDGNADHLRNITAQYCTMGIHNPQNIVGCDVENSSGNGIVYDTTSGSSGTFSIHDGYFANNNLADSSEGTDIYGNSSNQWGLPLFLTMSGHCVFMGNTTQGENTTYPYRRLMGNWELVTRTGATQFTPTTQRAQLDVSGIAFLDASTETNSTNVSWTSGSASSSLYDMDYVAATPTTKP